MTEQEPHTADEMLRCEEVEGCPPRLKLSELEEGDELVSPLCGMLAAAALARVGRAAGIERGLWGAFRPSLHVGTSWCVGYA